MENLHQITAGFYGASFTVHVHEGALDGFYYSSPASSSVTSGRNEL